jgi:pyridoxine kinase
MTRRHRLHHEGFRAVTPVVLAISSHVCASTVGLKAATPAFHVHGVEAWLVPTVLFGLHPGWGRRAGQALSGDELASLLDGVLAHPAAARLGWIATGHFSSAAQIEAVLAKLPELQAKAAGLKLLVDPIMGDVDTGLYVKPEVAEAIAARLFPIADLVTPNAWEAERLTGVAVGDPASAVVAARALGRPALITSVRRGGRIGAVYVDESHMLFAHAPERPEAPHGTGDLLAAAFLAATVTGAAPAEALLDAVRRVAGAIAAAEADGLPELPAVAIARGAVGPAAIEAIER